MDKCIMYSQLTNELPLPWLSILTNIQFQFLYYSKRWARVSLCSAHMYAVSSTVAVAKCCQRKAVKTSYLIYVSLSYIALMIVLFFLRVERMRSRLSICFPCICFLFGWSSTFDKVKRSWKSAIWGREREVWKKRRKDDIIFTVIQNEKWRNIYKCIYRRNV